MFPAQTGYDRAITIFSPEGKLYQVDYAEKAVKRAPSAIGIKTPEGIVLLAEKQIDKLMEPESIEKIFVIDDHIGAVMCGLYGDARALITRAREEAQSNKLTFGEPISTLLLTKRLCDYIQLYTQTGGVRPFGVMLIIGGIDNKLELYITHPSGAFYGYKAVAVGERSDSIRDYLEKTYKENMSLPEAVELGVRCLKTDKKEELQPEAVEMGIVSKRSKKFVKLSLSEVEEILTYAEKKKIKELASLLKRIEERETKH